MTMFGKKDIAYRVYSAKTKVNVFDLLYECGIDYGALKPILDECVAEKILATEDGKYYEFIGDGRMFSGQYGKHTESSLDCASGDDVPTETIEECEAEDADEPDEQDEDDDAFFRVLGEVTSDDDCDAAEWEFDDEEDIYTLTILRNEILRSMLRSLHVERKDGAFLTYVNALSLCGKDARFKFVHEGGRICLSDQGVALSLLKEDFALDEPMKAQAKRIAGEYGAEIIDGCLCIELKSKEQMLACLFRLCAAAERIAHIGDVQYKTEEEIPARYIRALRYVVKRGTASYVELHSEFGFAPSDIFMMVQWMEREGFVGPFDRETGGRKALLSVEEFECRFGKK